MKVSFLALVVLGMLAGPVRAGTPAVPVAELQADKTRLVARIEANQREEQQRIVELRAYIKKYGKSLPPAEDRSAMRFSIDPKHILDTSLQQQKGRREFLEIVRQEDASRIPSLLKTIYLSCDQGTCQHALNYQEVEDLIAAFGALALLPLLDQLDTLDALRRESVLNLLLRAEPLQCPMTALDHALADPVFRVRAAALGVFKHNCDAKAFYQRLNLLLASESEPDFLMYLLNQVPDDSPQNSMIYNRLIRLVQDQRIPVDKSFGKLCSATMSPAKLEASALNIPFWLVAFEVHERRRGCLVENLFLKLDQERHLLQLRRLFQAVAEYHYRFSATQGLYGQKLAGQYAYWDAIPGADDGMLNLFKTRLSPSSLRAWLNAPDAALGEKLLLSQWLGQDVAQAAPGTLRLQLEVRSPSNVVVSSTIQAIRLDQPFKFTLAPLVPGFQEVHYQGTVRFDPDQLHYRIQQFVVGLKPAGVGFEPVIPVTGSFETDLLLRQEKYRWKIRLTPASNRE